MNEPTYHVRQYRPNYFSGFDNAVVRDVSREAILQAPWFRNFEREGFDHFSVEPCSSGELIISAHYKDGAHWVAGFAVSIKHELAKNWRYAPGNVSP
jgi:hypothetical protein